MNKLRAVVAGVAIAGLVMDKMFECGMIPSPAPAETERS